IGKQDVGVRHTSPFSVITNAATKSLEQSGTPETERREVGAKWNGKQSQRILPLRRSSEGCEAAISLL
ncbi:MAG: hypothetical protein U9R53_00605, partial [Chloroflexota bacterium]|nr:hypothetical protein [Chloroflexota bacterium]